MYTIMYVACTVLTIHYYYSNIYFSPTYIGFYMHIVMCPGSPSMPYFGV